LRGFKESIMGITARKKDMPGKCIRKNAGLAKSSLKIVGLQEKLATVVTVE